MGGQITSVPCRCAPVGRGQPGASQCPRELQGDIRGDLPGRQIRGEALAWAGCGLGGGRPRALPSESPSAVQNGDRLSHFTHVPSQVYSVTSFTQNRFKI